MGIVSCIAKGQADDEKRAAVAAAVEAAKTPEQKEAEAKQKEVEAKQKARNDANLNVALGIARKIKASAKDPSTFKLESLLLYENGSACYEYRGKNSFGASVPARAVWDAPKKKVLASEQDGNAFVSSWNAICTKPGKEMVSGINLLGGV